MGEKATLHRYVSKGLFSCCTICCYVAYILKYVIELLNFK